MKTQYKHLVLCEVNNVCKVELYRFYSNDKGDFNVYENVTKSTVERIKRFFPTCEVERVDDDGWIKKRGINTFVETNQRLHKTYTTYIYNK